MNTLPVDLLCAIFSRLVNDHKPDLASCSSVSWLWRQITLPQLFEKLCIRFVVQGGSDRGVLHTAEGEEGEKIMMHIDEGEGKLCILFDEKDDNDPDPPDWHRSTSRVVLPSFVAFLKRRPDIAASVRILVLTQEPEDEGEEIQTTNPETLFLIFNQLHSLCNLELIDIKVGETHQPDLELVVNRHLDRLSINLYRIRACSRYEIPATSIIRILSFFRSISSLPLLGVFVEDSEENSAGNDMVGFPLPLIKHLEIIDVCVLKPLVSVMQSRSLLRKLETLKMDNAEYVEEDLQPLENFIAQVSSTFLHFALPAYRCFYHVFGRHFTGIILLALTANGSLNWIILSFDDRYYGVRKRPFHEVVSCFDDIFPRLRKKGILKCVGLDEYRYTCLLGATASSLPRPDTPWPPTTMSHYTVSNTFPSSSLRAALAVSVVDGSFADTAYQLFSKRLANGKVGAPQTIYASSTVLKASGEHFRAQLDGGFSTHESIPEDTAAYGYESDSDIDDSEYLEKGLLTSFDEAEAKESDQAEETRTIVQKENMKAKEEGPNNTGVETTLTMVQSVKYTVVIPDVAAET
ncbi:hypothetical protein PHLCEN_2v205 [Hermanssonia centrifuga]|uniref:F-box domain-containing protein n=1 Tax=Hermanssonia centrifuga TaxID=98765 RepID=A0A2R6S6N5_9APHY|nr:hypothetical protein PHLCEN_2v205 [Hermanssonia centrifuga]